MVSRPSVQPLPVGSRIIPAHVGNGLIGVIEARVRPAHGNNIVCRFHEWPVLSIGYGVHSDPERVYPYSVHWPLTLGAIVTAHQEFTARYCYGLRFYYVCGGNHHLLATIPLLWSSNTWPDLALISYSIGYGGPGAKSPARLKGWKFLKLSRRLTTNNKLKRAPQEKRLT